MMISYDEFTRWHHSLVLTESIVADCSLATDIVVLHDVVVVSFYRNIVIFQSTSTAAAVAVMRRRH